MASRLGMGSGFTVGVLGGLLLFHAAFSTIQYRGLLKMTEEDFSGPPLNVGAQFLGILIVVFELVLGFMLCMYAGLTVPGKFRSIHPHTEENRILSLPANLDFMIFNHRGGVLSPDTTDMKLRS